ncbi:hypothetical protein [Tychonema sp. LEGE 06208]|nr:hypothetical protein [Tychonema sp. LEGE 06208]MBE9161169.1 hypothetical protein [Tychonema sp. LEGE 06208]
MILTNLNLDPVRSIAIAKMIRACVSQCPLPVDNPTPHARSNLTAVN